MTGLELDRRTVPVTVKATAFVLVFLGLTALAGGIALAAGAAAPPTEWLTDIPVVDSWLIPGLVLGLGFGAGSLIVAYGLLRRPVWPVLRFVQRWTGRHWSWAATILVGLAHLVWIGLELRYLPELSWLQVVYGTVGVLLAGLPWLPAVRDWLRVDR